MTFSGRFGHRRGLLLVYVVNSTTGAALSPPPALMISTPFSNSLTASLTVKLDRTNSLEWEFLHHLQTTTHPTLYGRLLSRNSPSQSKARLLQLKGDFSHIKNVSLSIADYVDKVQTLSNSITIVGSTIGDQELIWQLLNGL
uniref:Uncharacterized protein n=1 Tax=Cannabis sativa TaxID=3483 RepID=A0A803PXX5_CANSA